MRIYNLTLLVLEVLILHKLMLVQKEIFGLIISIESFELFQKLLGKGFEVVFWLLRVVQGGRLDA